MTTHPKKLMVLQYETATPGTWANLCGINNMTLSVENSLTEEEKVPCTDRSDAIEKIVTYGMQGFTASISGLFETTAAGEMVADAALAQDTLKLRALVPGYKYIECANWFIGSCTWTGGTTGSLEFAAELSASGTITLTDIS